MKSIESRTMVGKKGLARKINARIRMASINSRAMVEKRGIGTKIDATIRMTSVNSRKIEKLNQSHYSYVKSNYMDNKINLGKCRTHIDCQVYGHMLKCRECNYQSNDERNFVRHVRAVHMKIRRFKCEMCELTFAAKCNADKHMLKLKHRLRYRCGRKINARKRVTSVNSRAMVKGLQRKINPKVIMSSINSSFYNFHNWIQRQIICFRDSFIWLLLMIYDIWNSWFSVKLSNLQLFSSIV